MAPVSPQCALTPLQRRGQSGHNHRGGPENQVLARIKKEVNVEEILTETEPLDEDHLISEEEMDKLEKEL